MPTFRQILASMTSYLQGLGSKLTDFTPTSVLYQILASIASVIDQIYFSIDNATKQAYIHSSTGEGLDAKGQDLGIARKQPTQAVWVFTFTKKQGSAQQIPIPKGTVITTLPRPGLAPITFKVDADSFLPTGTLQVDVKATCQTPGSIGNLAPQTPLLIGSATPGIDGVVLLQENMNIGTPGIDLEEDQPYRERLIAGLASKAQGTKTWYEQTVLSVEGVQTVKVVPQGRGAGTVDVYIVGSNNTTPSPDLLGKVQRAVDAGRIITDDAKILPPLTRTIDVNITIKPDAEANLEFYRGQVQEAIRKYVNKLGIGGGVIGALYLNQLIRIALEVEGVVDVLHIDLGEEQQSSVVFSPFQLPQAGVIHVE